MKQFRDVAGKLRAKTVRFLPGEHDAALDRGDAYQENFGDDALHLRPQGRPLRRPRQRVGSRRRSSARRSSQWLADDLAKQKKDAPIAVLTHRPLFDLYPEWDWATKDGAAALALLEPFKHVTVFYGHIHQEHHHTTGHIEHHSAASLIFPLPAPGSVPKKAPVAVGRGAPVPRPRLAGRRGLSGRRLVPRSTRSRSAPRKRVTKAALREDARDEARAARRSSSRSLSRAAATSRGGRREPRVVRIVAKRFSFTPSEVRLKKGEPVVLELVSEDRVHGFKLPGVQDPRGRPPEGGHARPAHARQGGDVHVRVRRLLRRRPRRHDGHGRRDGVAATRAGARTRSSIDDDVVEAAAAGRDEARRARREVERGGVGGRRRDFC